MTNAPDKIWVHNIIARGILPVGGKSEHVSIALTKDNNCEKKYILNTPAAMLAAGYIPITPFVNDGSAEANWIEHETNSCPHCGGSGHKDDVRADQAVSVKPLEWEAPCANNNWCHIARTPIGDYYVAICGGKHDARLEQHVKPYEVLIGETVGELYQAQGLCEGHWDNVVSSLVFLSATTTQPQRLDYFIGFEAGREAAAMVVDECNNEGPFEAIAAAGRIRAIPTPPYKSGHVSLITQPATPDIDAPQNVYSGEIDQEPKWKTKYYDLLEKFDRHSIAMGHDRQEIGKLHSQINRLKAQAAEVRNAALQEAADKLKEEVARCDRLHDECGNQVNSFGADRRFSLHSQSKALGEAHDKILALMTKEKTNG